MKKILLSISFFLASTMLFADANPPKLIVQIVIDQLRGDLITQYQNDFGPDGFNYLLKHSINYQNAHHPHALTVTCVGHTTISTGSSPSLHGIIANDWYDPISKKIVYCTEDQSTPILKNVRGTPKGPGQSPHNILASTFSDEVVLSQKGRSFAVSLKDRSAISLAGHAGKAFWFDKENGGFITSQYYYKQMPEWINQWNTAYHPVKAEWTLLHPINTYRYGHFPSIKHDFPGYGSAFPHQLGEPNTPTYYKNMGMSPFADRITAEFAMQVLSQEKLGKTDKNTDYLGISFSAVDIIGHQFGPNSLESEDNLKQLDNTIAKLLQSIDKSVGLEHTFIILTADHGMTDSPNWLKENHMNPTAPLDMDALKTSINQLLSARYQLPNSAIEMIKFPYIYLDHAVLASKGLSVSEVSSYLSAMLRREPHLFSIYPLPLIHNENDWLSIKVSKMAFPSRSGDLFIVPNPYEDIRDTHEIATTHGSPWNYDSYVPLLFVNPKLTPAQITRPVATTDIASTLAAILQIKAPSGAIGKPLKEVLEQYPTKETTLKTSP